MSWNFILLMLLMYVRCDESSLYSRINYVHSPDRGNFSAGVSGIIKTMPEFKRVHVLHYANAPVLTRKKPDVMIGVEDLC